MFTGEWIRRLAEVQSRRKPNSEQIDYCLEISPKCRRTIMYRELGLQNPTPTKIDLIRVEAPELIFVTAQEILDPPRVFILIENGGKFWLPSAIPNLHAVGVAEICLGSALEELMRRQSTHEPLNVVDLFWNSVFTANATARQISSDWGEIHDNQLDFYVEAYKNQRLRRLILFLEEWKIRDRIPYYRRQMSFPR